MIHAFISIGDLNSNKLERCDGISDTQKEVCKILYYENFDLENVVTPVNVPKLAELLQESQYDPQKSKFLIDSFTNWFSLGYQGNMNIQQQAPNLKFRIGDEIELWNKVMKEVKGKRYAGPYEQIPFKNYIQSLIGLVPKDGHTKTHLIFHLSYPRNTGRSINENTPKELCKVHYSDLDQAIKCCIQEGKSCKIGKSDMTLAFRHLGIMPES